MNNSAEIDVRSASLRIRWFMAAAWLVVLIKCAIVVWAVQHWHMPFHAGWIVLPTLAFAALATLLWTAHRE